MNSSDILAIMGWEEDTGETWPMCGSCEVLYAEVMLKQIDLCDYCYGKPLDVCLLCHREPGNVEVDNKMVCMKCVDTLNLRSK